ncbi:DUF3558 family protein [Actinokineospora cianjurensis]|uniref:Uncharacterized protein DUF3558 n=1 Tax=Actinokineospora cianjurensis TaxID=585224 RepID=A0A421BCY2_9PSEU|nr:DUF3558 family protein [Actinokineospora cianjurensis]RLK62245.1 uncharacterized protein DUF3558 [Actinokineospora cianjurensis]
MRRSLLGLVLGFAVVAGCTSQVVGSPTAVVGDPQVTTTRDTAPTSAETAQSIKPCSLLSAADLRVLGAGAGAVEQDKNSESCLWRVEKPLASESYLIGVTWEKDLAVGELVAGPGKTPVEVGRHKGVRAPGLTGPGCVVSLGITATSRVDVRTVGRGDVAALCAIAMAAAEKVEVRLP